MAGRIPESFINDLLARIDIVDVIDERVPLKKAGKSYQARCPFHEERTPSFTVAPDKQFYYCFGCGASGTAIGFLMEYDRLDFVEAVHDLAARVGMTVPTETGAGPGARSGDTARLYHLLEQTQQYYSRELRDHPQSERAKNYLKARGLDGPTAAAFRLGYAPPGWDNLLKAVGANPEAVRDLEVAGMLVPKEGSGATVGQSRHYDRFRDRIMFPIHDHRGRVIGFGGRILEQGEPKYLNSPETPVFHKGRELYGLFHARKANRQLERLFVVEGYMDVIALHQHGVSNAVATLGTATTRDHLERLFRVTPEVVFCFDGDEAGHKAAWRALETSLPLLGEGHYVSFLFLPEGEDPDTLVRKVGVGAFEDAARFTPLSAFLFDTLAAQVNLATLDGRARLIDLAKPLLSLVPGGALKQMLALRLSRLSDLDLSTLAPMIGGVRVPARADARQGATAPPREGRSLVRHAITLLLHVPALALRVERAEQLVRSGQGGADLLSELIAFVQSNPNAGSGALIEHWRDRPEGRHLQKLLAQDLTTPVDGVEAEFLAAIDRLRALAHKTMRAELARKPLKDMTEEEKSLLRQLPLSEK
ncbi:MAG: DNA primase [Gammaproteobacteria bacterium]|nr:DNA primase [Gammaproteobacteria bacterium]